ncbi:hypothetical protein FSP39_000695 [Pinctada imbricata]|uniref:UvrD-like helicase C-terminal domain-containing protein n=1 Tax=Pinctada imbricata TaxID=66713 RepID=A0AA89BW12_PINIB|nr:hypothetical protein FSP39_000695 [Pinctada imbricata]
MKYEKKWNERKSKPRKQEPVYGVFRLLENDEPDDSDDEDEDDVQFLNFQEMNSMNHGKTFVEGRRQKELKEGQYVCKAIKFTKLFYLLPQLLPMQFLSIIDLPNKDLAALEKDIEERPWVFGFKKFLSKDHHILGCEAPYEAFELSGLVDKIEQPYKDALIVYDFLKMNCRDGHTCGKADYVKSELRNYIRGFDAAVAFLTRNKIVKVLTINRVNWIFLHHLYHAEKMIAKYVDKMFRYQLDKPWILDAEFQSDVFNNIRSDPDQMKAAKALTQLPVVVISGKGGCGKTTVVTKVMSNCDLILPDHLDPSKGDKEGENRELSEPTDGGNNTVTSSVGGVQDSEWDTQDIPEGNGPDGEEETDPEENDWSQYPVIIYTAPTGKAANLLGKRATTPSDAMLGIRTPGFTLHQVIWSYRAFLKPPTEKEKEKLGENGQKKWKFKNVHTVVVDECSLVAVTTFETMISALVAEAKLRRIILLGDVRQLPSIEPGNFLADMFNILKRYGCSFELKTNHRSESQLIVDNATRISLRQYPVFDKERRFILHPVPENQDNNFINDVILNILRKEKELQDDISSQFVTFTNQTINIINAVACTYYNSHTLVDHKNKKIFRQNDKICMKKNGLVTLYERDGREMKAVVKKEGAEDIAEGDIGIADNTIASTQIKNEMSESKESVRLCNGEIFFIDEDFSEIDKQGKETRYLHLNNRDSDDPRKLWVNFREVRKKCKINHSWARTIHTFQGSEAETVVYVLGSTVSWQNWQHVYTAVTRGKKSVHIVGPGDILQKAVQTEERKRLTKLDYQLVEKLPVSYMITASN